MTTNRERPPGLEEAAPDCSGVSRPTSKWRDLAPRAASAVVLIVLALGALWWDGVPFLAFWLLAGFGLHWEWQRLAADGPRLAARMAIGGVVLALCADFASHASPRTAMDLAFLGALVLAAIAAPGRRLWSGFGMIYASAPVIAVCALRSSMFDGPQAILWLFAVVWGTDVMAYFGGRLIGGPKLWTRLSPSKTWAGFLVGICFGSLFGAMILAVLHVPTGEGPALVLGALIGVVSQAGDLFESAIKRHFGAKDSSGLIPGHGGLMDRLDGFVAASSFAAILGVMRAGAAAAGLGLLRW